MRVSVLIFSEIFMKIVGDKLFLLKNAIKLKYRAGSVRRMNSPTGSSIMNDIFLLLISQGYKGQNNSKPFYLFGDSMTF